MPKDGEAGDASASADGDPKCIALTRRDTSSRAAKRCRGTQQDAAHLSHSADLLIRAN